MELSTGYGLDGPGSNPGGGEIFRTCPDRPWGPPSLLYNGYWVFPGGKELPGCEADPSPPSSVVVKKEWSYTSTPPMGPTACTEPQCLYKCALYRYLYLYLWNYVIYFCCVINKKDLYCYVESRISCEIHVGRQCSYRCSYKMVLLRKHTVHQSMTPFKTERYSRPRHLAASFPFPAQTKNRKIPLPNRPIRWRTLYNFEHSGRSVIPGLRDKKKSTIFLALTQRRILIPYGIFGTNYRSQLQVPSSIKFTWTT